MRLGGETVVRVDPVHAFVAVYLDLSTGVVEDLVHAIRDAPDKAVLTHDRLLRVRESAVLPATDAARRRVLLQAVEAVQDAPWTCWASPPTGFDQAL